MLPSEPYINRWQPDLAVIDRNDNIRSADENGIVARPQIQTGIPNRHQRIAAMMVSSVSRRRRKPPA